MKRTSCLLSAMAVAVAATAALGAPFDLLTGVDARLWPGSDRIVAPDPGPGFDGTFRDGDRLAGTLDVGVTVDFVGVGTPLFPPNHVGALSFLFRRGSVPIPPNNVLPLMGIDFLGGPLLDLDGDLNNGARSLVPVFDGGNPVTPVEIPGTASYYDLAFDLDTGSVTLLNVDITGTNEGGPGISAGIATTLVTIAGTTSDGGNDNNPPNPAFDTRTGSLLAHASLAGVYQIQGLQAETWYDSIEPNSATADVLGTFQHFASFRGWLIQRDCDTGLFPVLSGAGLGSTLWPRVDTSALGQTFNTAHGLAGGTATIGEGLGGDLFTATGNGGLPLADFGGDLGAYLDGVVVPLLGPADGALVYLESAGFGINNSGDPVFGDTLAYDMVLIAAADSIYDPGDVNGDGIVDINDADELTRVLLDPAAYTACERDQADVNQDGAVNGLDIQALLDVLM